MVAVPAPTPVTRPEASTVATAVLLEDQVPPGFPLELKVVVPFEHIACVPLRVPATGPAVMVTSLVAVALAQPPVPVTV